MHLKVILALIILAIVVPYTRPAFARYNKDCKPDEKCLEIRQCPYFAALLDSTRKPRPRYVIREIINYQCGFNGNTPKVCCSLPIPTTTTSSTTTSTTATSATVFNVPAIAIKQSKQVPSTKPKKVITSDGQHYPPPPDVRLHRNLHLLPGVNECGAIQNAYRIFGGSNTSPAEFPWMALIIYYTKDGLDYRCGGSLINDRYVLTAGHCVSKMTMVGIRLGEHNVRTKEDCDELTGECMPGVQDFYIEDLIVHPGYKSSTLANDIALIRLATPVNFTSTHIQPVCLPLGARQSSMNLDNNHAIVAGWGVTESGFRSEELLKVSVPMISVEKCKNIYKNEPITYRQICAGGISGKDSCRGDSGGPLIHLSLVTDEMHKYVQYGIVSYGPRQCGSLGQPGVYTNIAYYMDWILDTIQR